MVCLLDANEEYKGGTYMTLKDAVEGEEYVIQQIKTGDEELNAFLFSLGCYKGETITVVAHRKGGCTVSIKDGRYNIDTQLANAIII
jgi:Fe2+ transport system protein FeoA